MKKIIFIITLLLINTFLQINTFVYGADVNTTHSNGSALLLSAKTKSVENDVFNIKLKFNIDTSEKLDRVNFYLDGNEEVYYFNQDNNYQKIANGKFNSGSAVVELRIPQFGFEDTIKVSNRVEYAVNIENIHKNDNINKTKLTLINDDIVKILDKSEPYLYTFENNASKIFRTEIYKKDIVNNVVYINCSNDCPVTIDLLGTKYTYLNGEFVYQKDIALSSDISLYTKVLIFIIAIMILMLSYASFYLYKKFKKNNE